MRKFTLSLMHAFLPAGGRNALPGKRGVSRALLGLSLGMALTPLAGAATSAQQQLLEQVRLGEATHREDLVRQSLYRLELIDPNDPQVIAARFRYLLRQGDSDGAQKLLDRLAQLAPESTAYQSSRTAMLLSTPQGRQSLQEARLLATTGHTEQAIASYDKLFKGYPPEGELAVEYWTTVAKLPARRHEAINQLQKINAVSPGNNALQNALAQLLFASGRRDEGFAVLKQMAKSSTGRSAASAIWYQQIKDLPVSDASVKALQDYLTQFSEGDSVSAARAQLSEQQKQLADPAFRARSQGIAAVNAGEGGKAIAPAAIDERPEDEGVAEAAVDAALRPKRSLWRKMVMGGLALFGASVVGQGVQWTMNAWQTQDWVALGGCAAGALIVGAGVGSVVTEWRRLWRLRQRAHERDEARELLHSHSVGKGRAFCEKLAQQAGIDQSHPALQRWYAAIHETQNDREIVGLYAHLVQPVLDAQARREISRFAAESTLMIAVSPLALVDMAFIAWRNLRLINRIATLYGIELGYYSRLRLFRLVLLNIAFAGASELVREVGMDWMSQDLAARLSTRAAQGIGAGILTARLGIKAMELCRPLPWIDNDKPRLGDFRRQLIGQLKETLQKSKSSPEK